MTSQTSHNQNTQDGTAHK